MKVLILAIFGFGSLLFNASSCCKDHDDTLPAETQEGKNTFGCLVNEGIWQVNGDGIMSYNLSASYHKSGLEIFANSTNDKRIQHFYFFINGKSNVAKYHFNSTTYSQVEKDNSSCRCIYFSDSLKSQQSFINITFLDTINEIVSGTFAFNAKLREVLPQSCSCDTSTITITQGRFDIHYFKQ